MESSNVSKIYLFSLLLLDIILSSSEMKQSFIPKIRFHQINLSEITICRGIATCI